MDTNLLITVGLVAALAAGGACAVAHWIAKRRKWEYIPRYVTGIAIGLTALVFPLFVALHIDDAVALWGVVALIFAVEGGATWLAHESDSPPTTAGDVPDADRILSKLDQEIRK